jgi:pyoverdine/dityrosine biosynthesis protein Dit1
MITLKKRDLLKIAAIFCLQDVSGTFDLKQLPVAVQKIIEDYKAILPKARSWGTKTQRLEDLLLRMQGKQGLTLKSQDEMGLLTNQYLKNGYSHQKELLSEQSLIIAEDAKELQFRIKGFPGKSSNPEKVIGTSLDLGELMALVTLEHLCQEALNIWGKKVSCQIICDGAVYQNVVGADAKAYSFFHKNMQDLIQKHFDDHLIFEVQPMNTFKESSAYQELLGGILKQYATDFANLEEREAIFQEKKKQYGGLYIFLSNEYLVQSKIPCVSFLPVCSALYDCKENFYNLTHYPNHYAPELVRAITSCRAVEKMQQIESTKKDKSQRSYQDWEIMQAAELMQRLSQAYSKFLKNSFPPNSGQQVIDLSVHPSSKGKFYLPLVLGSMGTPWHNALYVDRENSCHLKPSYEITGAKKKSSELKVGETKLNLFYYQA